MPAGPTKSTSSSRSGIGPSASIAAKAASILNEHRLLDRFHAAIGVHTCRFPAVLRLERLMTSESSSAMVSESKEVRAASPWTVNNAQTTPGKRSSSCLQSRVSCRANLSRGLRASRRS